MDGFWHPSYCGDDSGYVSPYRYFSIEDWQTFRADTPLTLKEDEVTRLRSMNDPISLEEVERVYLSLSRLLSSHVEAAQRLFEQRMAFLQFEGSKTPFIIGIAGPVAVGKSTTARILKELLARWPSSPKVDLVTTDGFLKPNAVLKEEGLMDKKGFPESYDVPEVLRFLSAIKAGEEKVEAPSYSHFIYDVLPDRTIKVDRPDILIFEGINVLQPRDMPREGHLVPLVSDYFDFAIYIDADERDIEQWYVKRFMELRDTAFRDQGSYFHRYSQVSEAEALDAAQSLWDRINLINLTENIKPTRPRADLILKKGENHLVERVALRKL
ncbi:MAG: type I pantothenate kinase [Pseudomonadota bacterium]